MSGGEFNGKLLMQTNEQFTVAGETGEAGTGELH